MFNCKHFNCVSYICVAHYVVLLKVDCWWVGMNNDSTTTNGATLSVTLYQRRRHHQLPTNGIVYMPLWRPVVSSHSPFANFTTVVRLILLATHQQLPSRLYHHLANRTPLSQRATFCPVFLSNTNAHICDKLMVCHLFRLTQYNKSRMEDEYTSDSFLHNTKQINMLTTISYTTNIHT